MNRPSFQFYPADWTRDTRALSPAAKGAWIDLLCEMHWSRPRGQVTIDRVGLARIIGTTVDHAEALLRELKEREIFELVTNENGHITVINRRMAREEKEREGTRDRQARHRERGGGDPDKWTAIRIPILIRDEYMCAYCGRKADTVDHIMPKSKGGTEDPSNLVACCKRCNMKKNNRTPEEAGMLFWSGFQIDRLNNTKITPPSSSSSSSSSSKDKKIKHKIPDDFAVSEGIREWAREKDLPDPDGEIEQFRDHHSAKGTTMLDWDAAFRTWLRNAKKWAKPSPNGQSKEQSKLDSMMRHLNEAFPDAT